MAQMTLATNGFEAYRKTTRKMELLSRMDTLIPWSEFCALIEPYYPKAGNERPPVGVERMLRRYFIANWFNMADEVCEDALHDIPALRRPVFPIEFAPACRYARHPMPDSIKHKLKTIRGDINILRDHKTARHNFCRHVISACYQTGSCAMQPSNRAAEEVPACI